MLILIYLYSWSVASLDHNEGNHSSRRLWNPSSTGPEEPRSGGCVQTPSGYAQSATSHRPSAADISLDGGTSAVWKPNRWDLRCGKFSLSLALTLGRFPFISGGKKQFNHGGRQLQSQYDIQSCSFLRNVLMKDCLHNQMNFCFAQCNDFYVTKFEEWAKDWEEAVLYNDGTTTNEVISPKNN